jgi:transposase, IS30 family
MQPYYSHITPSDRISIQALLAAKLSCRAIARQLNFHHSSVCREVNRAKACATASTASYRAGRAQERSAARRMAAGAARRKLGADVKTPLWRCVIDGLRCRWSPEQIAGKLRAMKPPASHPIESVSDSPDLGAVNALHVSHETIYCAIYAMPRGTLRSELVALLRKSHKTRLPRARGSARAGGLPNMTSIHLRPPEVAARIVPGHWEGDLIKGAMNRSSVGTLVERTSRYLMLVKLDGGCAVDILAGFKRRLKSMPPSLRKTMTYDQGSEMALHETLSAKLNMDIFFCDPHSPWQRGSNENANGLIREFLPKGMDLSLVSHQQLTAIEHALNHRPRKILGFESPAEVLSKLSPQFISGVALQA